MGCLMDCRELGPPPNSILSLPPPPIPAFLSELLLNSTACSSPHSCESSTPVNNKIQPFGGDYIELPRKDLENWSPVSGIDDTWLLVLVASSIGVLFLGALLAMFLLKCREMNVFGSADCSLHTRDHHHRPIKNQETNPIRDCTPSSNGNGKYNPYHPADAVLYHGTTAISDTNRMMWAALTPRGTQHFISENFPKDLVDYADNEDHYETIENVQTTLQQQQYHHNGYATYSPYRKDYEYEDPTPLIDRLDELDKDLPHYSVLENTDMRCANLGLGTNSLRRSQGHGLIRPRVSAPTRIEHPNLPPLNLYPLNKTNTLRRDTYRGQEGTLPKYGC